MHVQEHAVHAVLQGLCDEAPRTAGTAQALGCERPAGRPHAPPAAAPARAPATWHTTNLPQESTTCRCLPMTFAEVLILLVLMIAWAHMGCLKAVKKRRPGQGDEESYCLGKRNTASQQDGLHAADHPWLRRGCRRTCTPAVSGSTPAARSASAAAALAGAPSEAASRDGRSCSTTSSPSAVSCRAGCAWPSRPPVTAGSDHHIQELSALRAAGVRVLGWLEQWQQGGPGGPAATCLLHGRARDGGEAQQARHVHCMSVPAEVEPARAHQTRCTRGRGPAPRGPAPPGRPAPPACSRSACLPPQQHAQDLTAAQRPLSQLACACAYA